MGHAGQLADEGGGQPVRPLPGPVATRLPQVVRQVVMPGREVAGVGAGVAEPQRGPLELGRRGRVTQFVFQAGAGAEDRGEPGGVGVVLEDLLALAQQPSRLLQPPQPDQRPCVIEPGAGDLVVPGAALPFAGGDLGVQVQALLPPAQR
jgi:hypothetical protein